MFQRQFRDSEKKRLRPKEAKDAVVQSRTEVFVQKSIDVPVPAYVKVTGFVDDSHQLRELTVCTVCSGCGAILEKGVASTKVKKVVVKTYLKKKQESCNPAAVTFISGETVEVEMCFHEECEISEEDILCGSIHHVLRWPVSGKPGSFYPCLPCHASEIKPFLQ